MYKGRLHTGEAVAVKVQRPYVLETVTVDLYILRELGTFLRNFPKITAVGAAGERRLECRGVAGGCGCLEHELRALAC